ncbi:MAG: hypothetical protein R6V58_05055 [Planctomycetota bacterium]
MCDTKRLSQSSVGQAFLPARRRTGMSAPPSEIDAKTRRGPAGLFARAARLGTALLFVLVAHSLLAADLDEFKIKRRGPFEFAQKPAGTRDGDRITIRFKARAFCDATVAIEDANGQILRHLASGVLGKNAPEPFQKNSLAQTVVWDGKDDAGEYVDHKDACTVRVSLGLRPRFERTLYWTPRRRSRPPLIVAGADGVYVNDSDSTLEHIRLFDHDGEYVRTVHPFPADKIADVPGLHRHTFPQDGKTLALKPNFLQTTMLVSGNSAAPVTYKPESRTFESVVSKAPAHFGQGGKAATGMAVHGNRLAVAFRSLNRLGADGGGAGAPVYGPRTSFPANLRKLHSFRGGKHEIGPRSVAFSPDGNWLYLSKYYWYKSWNYNGLHGVARLRYDGKEPAEVFAGSMDQKKSGSADGEFSLALGVATDAQGRVYVADHNNDRIQVFNPDGKHLKNIPTFKPALVRIHPRNGGIWVFSWAWANDPLAREIEARSKAHKPPLRIPPELRRLGSFDDPSPKGTWQIPLHGYPAEIRSFYYGGPGPNYAAELDFHTDPPTLWLDSGGVNVPRDRPGAGIRLFRVHDDRLEEIRDFAQDLADDRFADSGVGAIRQVLAVNPATGNLHVMNWRGIGYPDVSHVTRINPDTGRTRRIELPFKATNITFDLAGRVYLMKESDVVRYQSTANWREVPWDYGEQRAQGLSAISALPIFPSSRWQMAGMHVSPQGHLAVATYQQVRGHVGSRPSEESVHETAGYVPQLYPGRVVGGKRAMVHVWDRHGRLLHEDAIRGLPDVYGIGIDSRENLYVLSGATRVYDGTRHFNDMTGTLMRFAPGKGRILSRGRTPVPLSAGLRPDRPVDLRSAPQGDAWVEGADWMYGGLGHFGKNRGVGCACWNSRFDLDYFGRSFAPEQDRYSVAVLDSAGNLILRVGRYGNVDDGMPLVKRGGPPSPRSIGGDEVALFHGAYIATHSDRRLFIADPGNARLLSVKLGYHEEAAVALEDVPDGDR